MKQFYRIVLFDYLQRARSYAFLITLAISLYAAYSFLPPPNASYTTVMIGTYVGVQNAAWIGYVTAMMSSIFICWIGFYLVSTTIKRDMDTRVGMIIATTSISNFQYLLAKAWSNFLVLLSILGAVFLMSIALFFVRHGSYPFEPLQFILPYLVITIPAIFCFAALAVIAEVFLYKYSILMNIGFFFLFCLLLSSQIKSEPAADIFGVKPVTTAMQQTVSNHYHAANNVSMGFNDGNKTKLQYFIFNGIKWSVIVILSRIGFVCVAVLLIFISSRFFHRFDVKEKIKKKRKIISKDAIPATKPLLREIKLSALPSITPSYKILPFIKTELLMLYRKGPQWLWFINLAGMIALIFSPLTIAHQVILPLLWFLQVARWSDLATKEKTNRIHYFTFVSYKPLTRLLPAQILAGIILALSLAAPLIVRCLIELQFDAVLNIIIGGIFIVFFAVVLGILSGGKRLFEILFFLITYSNIQLIPFADYFGGMNQGLRYSTLITVFIAVSAFAAFTRRKMELIGL